MRDTVVRLCFAVLVIGGVIFSWWNSGASAEQYVSRQVVSTAAEPGQWRYLGPTPIGVSPRLLNAGRAISFAVDPSDARRWLVGSASSGIWESVDAGATWGTTTDTLPSLSIGAIAFAPGNPNVIYAATGEGNFSRDGFSGVGLLKSTDRGASWSIVGGSNFAYSGVGEIRVHPNDANVVMGATIRSTSGRFSDAVPLSLSPSLGVLKSTNGGDTWVRTLAGDATDLEINPVDFNNQYAGIGASCRPGCSPATGAVENGVYRSTDGGSSWKRIDGPWSAISPVVGRVELALAPSNPSILYASIQGPSSADQRMLGLFRSDNAWADTPSWVQVPLDATGPTGYCDRQCSSANSMTVDPSDPSVVFAGGVELWRCSNCGPAPAWKNIGLIGNHLDHRALAWVGNRLIDINDGGVESTVDRGESWQNHNATMATVQIFSGALHPTNTTPVLAGTKDNGCIVYKSATTWDTPPFQGVQNWHGVCEGDVAISATHPDTDWMVSSDFAQIFRTRDGRTYSQAAGGITEPGAPITAPVRKCPHNDDVFLTGNTRLWRTTNFFTASEPSWAFNGPETAASVRGLAFADADRSCNTYAFGTVLGNVFVTSNGGSNWTGLQGNPLPARPVNALGFDPQRSDTLYAGLGSFDGATPGRSGHLFKTSNAFAAPSTWSNISPPDDQPVNVIAADPRSPSTIYVGTDRGVWQSADGGQNWRRLGPETGMPNVPVHDLKFHAITGELYAFTFGRGVLVLSAQ